MLSASTVALRGAASAGAAAERSPDGMCSDVGIGPVLCVSIWSRSFQFTELRVATVLLGVPARLLGLRLGIDAGLLLLELLLPTKLILVRDLRLVHDADLQVVLILVPLEEAVLHVLPLVAEDLV